MVQLAGSVVLDGRPQAARVKQIAIHKRQALTQAVALAQMLRAAQAPLAAAASHSDHLVALFEQELSQERPVLSGDARDQERAWVA